ncbi:MAG: tetratricopeptide repeat protein [Proteobacteria bacterium]|nr:tetratricopeptide repeat protein [Pseudomonadota bacterium]
MAEKTEDDILFREIDEELRQDAFQRLWKAYGKYVFTGAVVLVLGVAGFKGWQSYDISAREALGARFQSAADLVTAGNTDEALKTFSEIANDGGGYQMLARFNQARIYARQGDSAGAAAAYRALAGDGAIDSLYRDVAVILGAYQELNDPGADLPGLAKRLEALRAETSPWRYSAREISGLLARRSGNRAQAKELFQGLANDPRAPQGVRARAQEMLSIIGK